MTDPMRPRSRDVTEGKQRAPARAMLRAVGFTDEDFEQAAGRRRLLLERGHAVQLPPGPAGRGGQGGRREAGGVPIEFTTIAVSDGISMGHEGMRASLVSREVIADSVELVMHAERLDGMVTIAGCDKSLPGMLMAVGAAEPAGVFLYGGTILPGHWRDRDITIQDVFEAVGASAAGTMTDEELGDRDARACPGAGLVRRHVHGEHDGCAPPRRWGCRCRAALRRLPSTARRDEFARASGAAVVELPAAGHPPPPRHDARGVRERDHRASWRAAARRTRCCTCWRSPPRPRSNSSSTTSTGSAGARRTSATCARQDGS